MVLFHSIMKLRFIGEKYNYSITRYSYLFDPGGIDERTYYFKEREQIFDRLKVFFTAPPDWSLMKKPSLSMNQFHFMTPDQ